MMKKTIVALIAMIIPCISAWADETIVYNPSTVEVEVGETVFARPNNVVWANAEITYSDASVCYAFDDNSNMKRVSVVGKKRGESVITITYKTGGKTYTGTINVKVVAATGAVLTKDGSTVTVEFPEAGKNNSGNTVLKLNSEESNASIADLQAATKIVLKGNANNLDMQAFTAVACQLEAKSPCKILDAGQLTLTETQTTGQYNSTSLMPNNYTHFNLEEIVMPNFADGRVGDYFCSWTGNQVQNIVFNNSITEIGVNAFNNCNNIETLTFPSSLKKICDGAFVQNNGTKLTYISFNEGLEYIGRNVFSSTTSIKTKTLTFPASLKFIGTGSFKMTDICTDIYFLGKEAPVVEANAFNTVGMFGNNGYNATANAESVTRADYMNGQRAFAVLHLRGDLTPAQIATFTDITRVYEASYTQNTLPGLETKKLSTSTPGLNLSASGSRNIQEPWLPNFFGKPDTYKGSSLIWPSQLQYARAYVVATNGLLWNGVDKISDVPGAQQELYRFTLISFDANGDKTPQEWDFTGDMDAQWWTICLPFNMTAKEIKDVFGEKTELCKFNKVERTIDKVTLYFADEQIWKVDTEDDDIILEAHHSYMIRPSVGDEPAVNYLKMENYQIEQGAPVPDVVYAQDGTEYHFVGNYELFVNRAALTNYSTIAKAAAADNVDKTYHKIPQYSYYLTYNADKTKHILKFQPYYCKGKWSPYTSVVKNLNGDDVNYFIGVNTQNLAPKCWFGDDVKDDSEATAIEYEYVYGSSADVFNLSGQKVRSAEDGTAGLPSGIYVKNGKKFVVK